MCPRKGVAVTSQVIRVDDFPFSRTVSARRSSANFSRAYATRRYLHYTERFSSNFPPRSSFLFPLLLSVSLITILSLFPFYLFSFLFCFWNSRVTQSCNNLYNLEVSVDVTFFFLRQTSNRAVKRSLKYIRTLRCGNYEDIEGIR